MSEQPSESNAFPGPPQPDHHHQLLHRFEGTFRSEVKIYMGPGEPMISTGTMINKIELGGLYLSQAYCGDKVDGPFPNFCGHGFWGYNQTLGKFEGFWIDNASTTMQIEYGQVDSSGDCWEMHSEFIPAANQPAMRKRSVIKWIDRDHHQMQTWIQPPQADEFLTMEIAYKRA